MTESHPLIIRLLWWLLYIFLTGLSCVMIYSLMNVWNQQLIVIEVDNAVNYKDNLPFPAVTVCPTTKIVAERFNFNASNEDIQKVFFGSQGSEILNNIKLICDEYDRVGETNVTSAAVIQFLFQYLAPRMSEVIDSDGTFTPIITNHGLCFSHNILDGREIFRENVIFHDHLIEHGRLVKGWVTPVYGFYSISNSSNEVEEEEEEISYYPKEMSPEYNLNFRVMSVPQESGFECKSEVFQFKVLLHNPAEIPFMIDEDATTFLTHQFISLSVKPEVISTDNAIIGLDPYKKNCFSDDEKSLFFFGAYTERNCLLECLTNITLSHCNCVTFYMPRLNTTKICSAKQLNCTKAARDFYDKTDPCDCLPPCLTLSYNTDIFTQYWPDFMYESSNVTVKSSSEYFFVSYKRKNVYDINSLISDIGGINGFFTGMTVSSIMKFTYFLIWNVLRKIFGFIRKLCSKHR